MQFYPRREWPSTSAAAPDGVDGWENGTAAFAEWERHLNRALPELAVHDLAQRLVDAEDRFTQACRAARFAGVTWTRIKVVTEGHPSVERMRRIEIDDRRVPVPRPFASRPVPGEHPQQPQQTEPDPGPDQRVDLSADALNSKRDDVRAGGERPDLCCFVRRRGQTGHPFRARVQVASWPWSS